MQHLSARYSVAASSYKGSELQLAASYKNCSPSFTVKQRFHPQDNSESTMRVMNIFMYCINGDTLIKKKKEKKKKKWQNT